MRDWILPLRLKRRHAVLVLAVLAAVAGVLALYAGAGPRAGAAAADVQNAPTPALPAASQAAPGASPATAASPASPTAAADDTVTLSDPQLAAIKVAAVAAREFVRDRYAVGTIDFNEDRTVQVFTPYPGRILEARPKLGDQVSKGQVLFSIESPDFIAAESNLISAAATLDQTDSALKRAKALYESKAIDQNDYETAVANQQSAQGALRAARHAVAVFGKTEAQIDRIVAKREVETALLVRSPITGRITARNAAPGLLEQPGNPPAPYSVADLSTMWMLAQVPEEEIAQFARGQSVTVSVPAHPGHVYAGTITAIGSSLDPNSRRLMLRSEIKDPAHELLPDMFATFVIRTGAPVRAPAVPQNGVVREGDGTMSVWVRNSDPHRFTRRSVKIGEVRDGYDEILEGLEPGESVAVDGAIFLSNILYGGAS